MGAWSGGVGLRVAPGPGLLTAHPGTAAAAVAGLSLSSAALLSTAAADGGLPTA